MQQGDQLEGVMVQEVVIKSVNTEQLIQQASKSNEVAKKVATQPAPLQHKPERDQDPIVNKVSTDVDGQVQLRMVCDNILPSPLTLLGVQEAS